MKTSFFTILAAFFVTYWSNGQSIIIDPNLDNTISSSSTTNYLDLHKTGTNNYVGLRFFQGAANRGGLYYDDANGVLNLSNGPTLSGIVWNRTTSRVGIGTYAPLAKLHIETNNSPSVPHILLREDNVSDGARINFENAGVGSNRWTLYGINSVVPSSSRFNFFHTSFGNILTISGDGNTKMEGYTQLGNNAPKIKMKVITGSFGNSEGSWYDIPHGLISSKILAVNAKVEPVGNATAYTLPNSLAPGLEYSVGYNDTVVFFMLKSGNAEFLLNRNVKVLITYEE
ncbi:hypothetical protein EGI22_04595 [Lacihabitans sp. LS3-19]|uniref:hypothetical protein n=1 Tax=Lacihabitans sp. LS3-19 TaxID=2487335 RepID=UPI0020CE7F6A|nr:hypothetical protein [Lacihabitans sp. LS3-19]MCP9767177.1 hypothetical protein [Lacihabitans sp. LS3-19]